LIFKTKILARKMRSAFLAFERRYQNEIFN